MNVLFSINKIEPIIIFSSMRMDQILKKKKTFLLRPPTVFFSFAPIDFHILLFNEQS
jgi:hypothetical protein